MTLLHYEPKTSQPAIRPELIAQLKYRAGRVADEDYSGDITDVSDGTSGSDAQKACVSQAAVDSQSTDDSSNNEAIRFINGMVSRFEHEDEKAIRNSYIATIKDEWRPIMEKKRLVWLDILKGISIFLVILSHTGVPTLYMRIYSPIFLSAFFFSSGYTFNPRSKFWDFFCHKLYSLGVPFVCYGIINAILAIIADGDSLSDRLLYLLSIQGKWDDLWFIACLFSTQLLFYFIWRVAQKISGSEKIGFVLIGLISVLISFMGILYVHLGGISLPLQFENACINVCFMALGYISVKLGVCEAITEPSNKMKWGGCCATIIYMLLTITVETQINVHPKIYSSWPLYLGESIIGLFAFVFICGRLQYVLPNKVRIWITYAGQNTLLFYAFQSKGIRACDAIANRMNIAISNYVYTLIVAFVVFTLLYIPAVIVNRWFPFINGKRRLH